MTRRGRLFLTGAIGAFVVWGLSTPAAGPWSLAVTRVGGGYDVVVDGSVFPGTKADCREGKRRWRGEGIAFCVRTVGDKKEFDE